MRELKHMKVVIIPAYEPVEGLIQITRILSLKGYMVIAVNDGSGSEYDSIFKEIDQNVVVLKHEVNKGKGKAIKTALYYIAQKIEDAEAIVVMDADGQHSIEDVERMLHTSKQFPNSLILGCRSFEKDVPLASRLGNHITGAIFHITSGKKISDTQTGLRAFQTSLIPMLLENPGERYEYEMNMLYTCVKRGIPIVEIPIKTIYHDRSNSCSHFHKIKDSARIYHQILKAAFKVS